MNKLFGIANNDTVANYREFQEVCTINHDIFVDYSTINWDNVAKLKAIGKTLYTTDDENRVDFCDFAKGITGDYLPNTAQQEGDCVAASFEVASEHLNCYEMWNGELQVFHQHFRPWLYGIGRVFIGKNQLGRSAGSLTSWQVEAAAKYGVLREGLEGVPKYSKQVAQDWGYKKSLLEPWMDKAKDFTIDKSVTIRNFSELCDVMIKGKMPVVIASMQGFRMELKVDKQANKSWFVPQGEWAHQMSILACEKNGKYPSARVHNQWGLNAHPDQLDGPDGTGWVSADFFDKWVRQRDCVCVGIGNFKAWRFDIDSVSVSPFK